MSTAGRLAAGATGVRLSRRRFMVAGVTVAAAGRVLGPRALAGRSALARLAAAAAPASVAFVAGAATFGSAVGRRAVPVADLAATHSWPAGALARFTVEGLASPTAARDGGLRRVHADALLVPVDPPAAEPAVFHAWTLDARGAASASGRVVFPWAIGRAPTIGLSLEAEYGTADQPDGAPARSRHVSVFSTADRPGTVPLLEGLYLLGLTPGAWDAPAVVGEPDHPSWRRHQSLVLTVRPHTT